MTKRRLASKEIIYTEKTFLDKLGIHDASVLGVKALMLNGKVLQIPDNIRNITVVLHQMVDENEFPIVS